MAEEPARRVATLDAGIPSAHAPQFEGDPLEQALAEARLALELARQDQWDNVAAHDARCRALVSRLTDDPGPVDPQELAEGLAGIRESYRELLSLAEARRDRLADAVRVSARGRAGARAYEENR